MQPTQVGGPGPLPSGGSPEFTVRQSVAICTAPSVYLSVRLPCHPKHPRLAQGEKVQRVRTPDAAEAFAPPPRRSQRLGAQHSASSPPAAAVWRLHRGPSTLPRASRVTRANVEFPAAEGGETLKRTTFFDSSQKFCSSVIRGKEKLEGSLSSSAILALVDTVYYKGQWDQDLDKENTEEGDSWLNKDVSKSMQMMKQSKTLHFTFLKDVQAKIPEIPNKASMILLIQA
eukprot:bmy_17008T0